MTLFTVSALLAIEGSTSTAMDVPTHLQLKMSAIELISQAGATGRAAEGDKVELRLADAVPKELVMENRLAEFTIYRLGAPIYLKEGKTEPSVGDDSPIMYVARYIRDSNRGWERILRGEKRESDSRISDHAEKLLNDPKERMVLEEGLRFGVYSVQDEIHLADGRRVIFVHTENGRTGKKLAIAPYVLKIEPKGWRLDKDVDSNLLGRLYFYYPFNGPAKVVVGEKDGSPTPTPPQNETLSLPFQDAIVSSKREK